MKLTEEQSGDQVVWGVREKYGHTGILERGERAKREREWARRRRSWGHTLFLHFNCVFNFQKIKDKNKLCVCA